MRCSERTKSKPPTERYKILDTIGCGSYGYVCKARCIKSGEVVAIKIIELEGTQDEIDDIEAEVKIMSQTSSPYIVGFYASYIVNTDLWIVMEYCNNGACAELICNGGLQEQYVFIIAREVLKGLDYLHSSGNLHRDIKAANILICQNGDVKLADFGVSGQLTSAATRKNTFVGTPYWMAPEVINQSGYNASADIWSLGITIIELSEGHPPHSNIHPMKALFAIPRYAPPRLMPTFSKALRNFVELCLNKNPEMRPSPRDLFKHRIVKYAKKNALLLEAVRAARKQSSGTNSNNVINMDPNKFNMHPKTKESGVYWDFGTVKNDNLSNDNTVKIPSSDLSKKGLALEQPNIGGEVPDDTSWFDSSKYSPSGKEEVLLEYYDKTVVCQATRNPAHTKKGHGVEGPVVSVMESEYSSSELMNTTNTDMTRKFESCSSNDIVYQNVVLSSFINSIDKPLFTSNSNELSRAADRLKAAIMECEKILPGCTRILIEDVISSIESKCK